MPQMERLECWCDNCCYTKIPLTGDVFPSRCRNRLHMPAACLLGFGWCVQTAHPFAGGKLCSCPNVSQRTCASLATVQQ
ncbi:hypothetical protein HanRHA438_Chr13g0606001 [Helianthus annuus]|nr:hypothetical protein HanRHA438_Chr13g0606001 [Helianthus annuus]